MTTTQAIQSVLDLTAIKSLDAASINHRLVLANCLTAAVQEWFELAPAIFKRTRSTFATVGPTTVACVFEPGETTASAEVFSDYQRGSTVVIAGDATWNEVVDRSTVLHPYRGSANSASAIVYGDCWPFFDFAIERIAGDVEYQTGDGGIGLLPPRETGRRQLHNHFSSLNAFSSYGPGWGFSEGATDVRQIRPVPTCYTLEPVGDSVATGDLDAAMMVRLDPIPSQSLSLSAMVDILPRAYGVAHVTNTPLTLPVPDERFHSTLLPILAYRVANSSIGTVEPGKMGGIREDANDARRRIALLPKVRHRTQSRILSKPGY